jgi:hypothetical protein
VFYLLFLVVHYFFLHIEPFQEVSDMQSNIKNFIVGMSPACLDSEYPCLGLDDINSWEMAAIWCAYSNFTHAKG